MMGFYFTLIGFVQIGFGAERPKRPPAGAQSSLQRWFTVSDLNLISARLRRVELLFGAQSPLAQDIPSCTKSVFTSVSKNKALFSLQLNRAMHSQLCW